MALDTLSSVDYTRKTDASIIKQNLSELIQFLEKSQSLMGEDCLLDILKKDQYAARWYLTVQSYVQELEKKGCGFSGLLSRRWTDLIQSLRDSYDSAYWIININMQMSKILEG